MKKILFLVFFVTILGLVVIKHSDARVGVSSSSKATVEEEDGSPTGKPGTIKFANGSVTDNGDGTFSVAGGGSGTVTQVDYGNGLTGGPITTTGTVDIVLDGSSLSKGASGLKVATNGIGATEINAANASADFFLQTDGAGTIVWTASSASVADNSITEVQIQNVHKLGTEVAIGTSSAATTSGTAVGQYTNADDASAAFGAYANASGTYSSAFGIMSDAAGTSAVAIGSSANASAANSIAVGYNTDVSAIYSSAFGHAASVAGNQSLALGYTANAGLGTENIAIGSAANSNNGGLSGSIAIGRNSISSHGQTVAIGRLSVASGDNSVAIGYNSETTYQGSVAIGWSADAKGDDSSTAIGASSSATGANSVALGVSNSASATNSVAIGFQANADGVYNLSYGYQAVSTGAIDLAIGAQASATGGSGVAIGLAANAASSGTVAIGQNAAATTSTGTAIGNSSEASGTQECTAVGDDATASGSLSVALGAETIASSSGAIAIGYSANSGFNDAVSLGKAATASASDQIMLGDSDAHITTGAATSVNSTAGAINATAFYDDGVLLTNTVATPITTLISETTVNAVGTAGQIYAGHIWDTDEFGSSDIALYLMETGALTTDEEGTYTLSDNGTVTECDGIDGAKNCSEFNGTDQYFTQGTLLDTTPTAIAIDLWIKPDDGQPSSAEYIFRKNNVTSEDWLYVLLNTDGSLLFGTEEGNNGSKNTTSSTLLANGAGVWTYICLSWDTTNGKRLWINGVLESTDSTATTLMGNGTDSDFTLGAITGGASGWFDGKISLFRVRDQVLTQKDVDAGYSVKHDISGAGFSGTTFQSWVIAKEGGSANFVSQVALPEVHRTTTEIYSYGGSFDATDAIAIYGRE